MPNYTTLFGTALSDYNLTRGKVPFLDNPDPTDGLYSCGAALMTAGSLTGTSYGNLIYSSLVATNNAFGKVEWIDDSALRALAADKVRSDCSLTNS